MTLADWSKQDLITPHNPQSLEIRDLLGIADRDLAESQTAGLHPDWQLSIAYNAALQAATAALCASGYRARGQGQHYRVIQSLAYTIGAQKTLIAQLDKFRQKRNISDYERAGIVTQQEANEMIDIARALRKRVEDWIRSTHPELAAHL